MIQRTPRSVQKTRKRGGEGVRLTIHLNRRQAARRAKATSLALTLHIQREATERPASPAAHSTHQARRLADEISGKSRG